MLLFINHILKMCVNSIFISCNRTRWLIVIQLHSAKTTYHPSIFKALICLLCFDFDCKRTEKFCLLQQCKHLRIVLSKKRLCEFASHTCMKYETKAKTLSFCSSWDQSNYTKGPMSSHLTTDSSFKWSIFSPPLQFSAIVEIQALHQHHQ